MPLILILHSQSLLYFIIALFLQISQLSFYPRYHLALPFSLQKADCRPRYDKRMQHEVNLVFISWPYIGAGTTFLYQYEGFVPSLDAFGMDCV